MRMHAVLVLGALALGAAGCRTTDQFVGVKVIVGDTAGTHGNPPSGACDANASVGVTTPTNTRTLVVGGQLQAIATVVGSTCTDTTVMWSSSDVTVATVSQSGLITGVKPGTDTIFATLNSPSHAHDFIVVTVITAPTTVTVTSANPTLHFCGAGSPNTTVYKIITNPADAFELDLLLLTTTNQHVAVNQQHGTITPVSVGTAVVQALLKSNPDQQHPLATFNVTVDAVGCSTTPPPLTITPTNPTPGLTLNGNGICSVSVPFTAGNVDASPTLVWSATGGTTTQNGIFTATQAGPASITATQGSRTVTVSFNVSQNGCVPTSSYTASFSGSPLQYCPSTTGGTIGHIVLTPPDATVTYSNNGSSAFTVSSTGTITPTGLGSGNVTVTGTGIYIGTNFTLPVTVGNSNCGTAAVTITVNPPTFSIDVGGQVTLGATASSGSVTWSTSNSNCVSLSPQGLNVVVTGINACSSVTVTATSTIDATKSASSTGSVSSGNITCTFTSDVGQQSDGSISLAVNQTANLTGTCTNQNGAAFVPFWYTNDTATLGVIGATTTVTIDGFVFYAGPRAVVRGIAAGSASVTMQASVTDKRVLFSRVVTVH